MPFSNSEWQTVDGTLYIRPFDGIEKFWYDLATKGQLNGQRQFDLVLTTQISFESLPFDVTQKAREAWMKLRTMHPGIAAFTNGEKWIYKAADDNEKAQWRNRTFVVVDSPHNSETYIGTLKCAEYPTMYYIERSKEFVIRAPHYYMDGRGAVTLMRDFLSEFSRRSSTRSSDEVNNLPLSASAAIGIPSLSEGLLEKLLSETSKPEKLVSLPHTNIPTTSGTSALFKVQFSVAETERISKTAKLNGVSVSHFVHAALVMAAKHQGRYATGVQYSTLVSTDLRDLCQNSSIAGSGAANLRMGWWPMSVEVDYFWTTIYRIQQGYEKIRSQKKAFLPALAPCLAILSPDLDTQVFNSIIMSSMGDVTSYVKGPYDGFEVANIWGTIIVKNQVVFTHVRSFLGEMEITTAYNEAFHHSNQLKDLLALAKDIMLHASTNSRL